ncbi:MAG TPA: hypothetical protein VFZ23_18105 [Pyrinomonadaceae bacterium]
MIIACLSKVSYRVPLLIASGLLLPHLAGAQLVERDLLKMIGTETWSKAELKSLEKGDAVVRALETNSKQELSTIGIVRIKDLPPVSMQTFRQSLDQKGNDTRKAGGRFSEPAMPDDLLDLELDDDAIRQLSKCSVGRCDLNLSAAMIRRFEAEVDWNSPEANARATQLMKEMLLAYVNGYRLRGDAALGVYDNRRKVIDLTASHRTLLASSSLISGLAPEFVEYLQLYPGGKLDNLEESVHWSVLDFGLKPSITLSHTSAYTRTRPEGDQLFRASKQIYASRYLDCSLTFTLLVRARTENGTDTFLILIDRSRSDALEGVLGKLARRMVRKESISRITELLEKAQSRLIASARGPAVPSTESEDRGSVIKRILKVARHPVALITGGIVVITLLFLVWRRRRIR